MTRLLQEGLLDIPINIIQDLVSSPTAERLSAALAALKQNERFSNLADWSYWEHLDFLEAAGTLWVCPLPDNCFSPAISYSHPGWGKYDPPVLIVIEKLSYLIHLKERCLASAMATVVERTLERAEFMVHVVEKACDENKLNGIISGVKNEVCISPPTS